MVHGAHQHRPMLIDFLNELADKSGLFGEARGVGAWVDGAGELFDRVDRGPCEVFYGFGAVDELMEDADNADDRLAWEDVNH